MRLFNRTRKRRTQVRRSRFPFVGLRAETLEIRALLDGALGNETERVAAEWFEVAPRVANEPTAPRVGSFAAASGVTSRPTTPTNELGAAQWIVRLTDEATRQAASVVGAPPLLETAPFEFQVLRGLGSPGLLLLETVCQPLAQVRSVLRENPAVRFVELDSAVRAEATPNDSLFSQQHNLSNTGQSGGTVDADIDAPEAWDVRRDSSSVVVGVIDSGVDFAHPDLFQNLWLNEAEIPLVLRGSLVDGDGDGHITIRDLNQSANAAFVADANGNQFIDAGDILADARWADGFDTDANGFIDDFFGWDFLQNDNRPFDEHRHGTHVTGILAATGDNGIGISGISWRSSVLPLRFLDANNEGSTAHAIAAFNYATLMRQRHAADVRVLNASWGGNTFSEALLETVKLAGDTGIITVAAAGNGDILGRGVDLETQPFYPASFDLPSVISVAASDTRDDLARFSNYGRRSVDLAAPGVGIWSAEPGNAYQQRNGTSMATPHVSGAVAIVSAHLPNATPTQVKQAILSSVDPLPQLQNLVATGGRLNVQRALLFDPVAPTATLGTVPNILQSGGASYSFIVTYADDRGIATSSIDDSDILVSRAGGVAFSTGARLVSIDTNGDGTPRVATYAFTPPDGAWDFADNGTYRITLRPNQVRDTGNNTVGGRLLGSFQVTIPQPPSSANELRVTSLLDRVDANPGDGLVADAAGLATLRAAVMEANARTGDDRIVLPIGTITLTLAGANEEASATGDLDLTSNVEFVGAGIDQTILDAGQLDRAMHVLAGATVTLRDLTIRGGSTSGDGGGVLNAGTLNLVNARVTANATTGVGAGGGIANLGTLHLTSSAVNNNTAARGAGGVHSQTPALAPSVTLDLTTIANNTSTEVGGLLADGPLTMTRSTIADNQATGTDPGALAQVGGLRIGSSSTAATISGSTISGNSSTSGVGGILNDGRATITNSTLSGNTGGAAGGIESGLAPLSLNHVTIANNAGDDVGGISAAAAEVQNSIIATNVARLGNAPDVGSGPFTTLGHNFIGIEEGTTNFIHNANGDQVGTVAAPIDPRMTTLADWGGPTKTHALLANSLAIDAAEIGSLAEDQRGAERTLDGGGTTDAVPDIGAFEFGTFFVNDTTDAVDATIGDGLAVDANGRRTLRAAIQEANASAARNVVMIGPGRFAFTIAGQGEEQAATGDLDVKNPLSVIGAGRALTVIDAEQSDRLLHMHNTDLDVSDLSLIRGRVEGSRGGAIYAQGNLDLNRVELRDNVSSIGGAIWMETATSRLRMEDGTIANNVASSGGGAIFVDQGHVEIENSQLLGNRATQNGGVIYLSGSGSGPASRISRSLFANNQANTGGAIFFAQTERGLTVTESTIESNTAKGGGGGVYSVGGPVPIRFESSLIANNVSSYFGGGLYAAGSGVVEFVNSTISGNRTTEQLGGGVAATDGSRVSFVSTTVARNTGPSAGGIYTNASATVTLLNSVIADNRSSLGVNIGADVVRVNGRVESLGGTLIGRPPQNAIITTDSDLIGTATQPIDARLGPLQDNGGPTKTHALRTGSPAIDAAISSSLVVDQRGVARSLDGNDDGASRPDMGAYEFEFGLPIRVEGRKFDDRNGDGVRGGEEAVLGNWTVFVDLDRDQQLDLGEPTTTTDDQGRYEFTGLEPGEVLIGEVARPEWEQVYPGVGRIEFATFGEVPVGDAPQTVVAADLDGDGIDELITADFAVDQVSIARGLAQGRFAAAIAVSVGRGPVDVIAADLDGDGDLDLATANFTGDSVTWLRNDGTGRAFTATTLPVGDGPRAIIAVDLDRDGDWELISADSLSNQISVLRNAGSGLFSAAQFVPAGELPQDIVAADFDGDGDSDLAIANLEAFTVTLLFNDDSGQLELFGDVDVGAFPRALAAGDLDGDGTIDLAVASSFSDSLSLLMNNGQGGFARRDPDLLVGRNPRDVVLVDFDHDQRLDIVTTNANDGTISLLRGLGRSLPLFSYTVSFAPVETYSVGRNPRGVAPFDVDRDGNVDLAIASLDGDTVSILRNTFGSHRLPLAPGDLFRDIDFGNRLQTGSIRGALFHDLDGDGTRDETEPRLPSWRVFLDANDNGSFDGGERFVLTDADGGYSFDQLEPLRTYVVREEQLAGWTQTLPVPPVPSPLAAAYRIELGIGETASGFDFGNHGAVAEIRGVKFKDVDQDGVRDVNEPTLSGWTIYVDLNENGRFDGNEPSAITNANGEYVIDDLPPATDFVIDEVTQSGWVKTGPPVRIEFAEPKGLPLPAALDSLAIGDLEGDGDQDFVVVISDGFTQELVALANSGQGRFVRKWSYVVSPNLDSYVTQIALGDVNKDGLLDVIVTEQVENGFGDARLTVFVNDGNARLTPGASRVVAGVQFSELVVRDFNGDGAAEIVFGPTAGSRSGMFVLTNDGTGKFPSERQSLLLSARGAGWQHRLIPGDFDLDGDIDLATGSFSAVDHVLGFYFNRGDGTFLPVALTNVSVGGSQFNSQGVGDLDGDGDLDIVTLNSSGVPRLDVLENQGNGSFATKSLTAFQGNLSQYELADLDADADLDIAIGYFDGQLRRIRYLRNDGRGRFVDGGLIAENLDARAFQRFADFNGDGRADMLGYTGSTFAQGLMMNANGRAAHFVRLDVGESRTALNFGAVEVSSLGGVSTGATSGLVFNDINGNGRREASESPLAGITVFVDQDQDGTLDANEPKRQTRIDNPDTPNDETGSYAFDELPPGSYTIIGIPPAGFELTSPRAIEFQDQAFPTGDGPQAIATADFDGDGDRDLAVANSETNNVSLLLNHGDATFAEGPTLSAGFGPAAIAAGDVDGDGKADLLVANRLANSVSVLRQRADRTWNSAATVALAGSPSALTLFDFDGDGDRDAAVSLERQNQVQLLRNASGVFTPFATIFVGRSPNGLHAADLDGDGDADLLTANFDGGNVSVLKNNGDGTFASAANLGTGRGAFAVTTADVDGDGNRDLLVANFLANTVSLLRNRGGGVFQPAENYPAGNGPAAVAATDLDHDGDLDLAVGNATTTNLSVLFNAGDGTFGAPSNFGVGDFPKSLAFALAADDFDGDGHSDLAVASSISNRVAILKANVEPGPYRFVLAPRQEVDGLQFGIQAINAPPTLDAIPPRSVDSNAPEQTIQLTGISAGASESQALRITATSSNPALIPPPSVQYTSPAATGKLLFTPAANQAGAAQFQVTVTDAGPDGDLATAADNRTTTQSFTVTVSNFNEPPTNLELSPAIIAENTDTSAGPVNVGTLSAQDPNAGTTLAYALVAGSGDTDNSKFTIHSATLQVQQGTRLDFETQPTYGIRVQVSDGSLTTTRTFAIQVTDVNEPPNVSLTNTTANLPESTDLTARRKIADIVISDDALGDETLGLAGAHADLFEIRDAVLFLKAGTLLDFESRPQLTVAVHVDDATVGITPDASATLTLAVTDVNEPPIAVTDDGGSTDEDSNLTIATPGVLANDSDVDAGDVIVVSRFDAISRRGAIVTVAANGAWTYDPSAVAEFQALIGGQSLTDDFPYTIHDGHDGTSTATVTITVRGVNDWTNPRDALDVDHDRFVSPIDVLLIINAINDGGARALPGQPGSPSAFLDTNGDGFLSPADALQVINHLNGISGEGESWLDLLAVDRLQSETRSVSKGKPSPDLPR